MLLRISLVVAILAGIGAGVVSYLAKEEVTKLTAQRNTEHEAKVTEIAAHGKTKTTLKKTEGELASTQQELTNTQGERDKAVARAEAQSKRADELSDKLAKAVQERDDAQNLLASYKATDLSPEQIIKLNKQLKDATAQIAAINGEKNVISRELAKARATIDKLTGTAEPIVKLRSDLKGKIVVVDPKWDFVVLNIGDNAGVLQDAELLVSRQGKLVAKVVIRSVQIDRCIANVVPGWKLGEMIEGDDVTPAHPAS